MFYAAKKLEDLIYSFDQVVTLLTFVANKYNWLYFNQSNFSAETEFDRFTSSVLLLKIGQSLGLNQNPIPILSQCSYSFCQLRNGWFSSIDYKIKSLPDDDNRKQGYRKAIEDAYKYIIFFSSWGKFLDYPDNINSMAHANLTTRSQIQGFYLNSLRFNDDPLFLSIGAAFIFSSNILNDLGLDRSWWTPERF